MFRPMSRMLLSGPYSQDQTRGHVRNIRFRNIQTIADIYNTPSLIGGYDSEHRIEDVRFENFVMGGSKILDADAIHLFSKHADGIRFE